MKLSKRERATLAPAVIYGWEIEIDPSGTARWDSDSTLPFRAFKTLDELVDKGLMERLPAHVRWEVYRATLAGKAYKCRAPRCQSGKIYGLEDHDCDTEVGKCDACDGTGVILAIATAPDESGKEGVL